MTGSASAPRRAWLGPVAAAVLVLLGAAGPTAARATECLHAWAPARDFDPADALAVELLRHDVVALFEVAAAELASSADGLDPAEARVTLRLLRAWKGDVEWPIVTWGTVPGIGGQTLGHSRYVLGQRYLVFGTWTERGLGTGACTAGAIPVGDPDRGGWQTWDGAYVPLLDMLDQAVARFGAVGAPTDLEAFLHWAAAQEGEQAVSVQLVDALTWTPSPVEDDEQLRYRTVAGEDGWPDEVSHAAAIERAEPEVGRVRVRLPPGIHAVGLWSPESPDSAVYDAHVLVLGEPRAVTLRRRPPAR